MVAPQKIINDFNHNIKEALRQTNEGVFRLLVRLKHGISQFLKILLFF